MNYETIDVAPVTGALGAEISGIDLRQPLGNQCFQEVHNALMAHQVIFFRDQDITPQQHIDFGRHFGELHVHPFIRNLPDHPEVIVLENDAERPPRINAWHTDVTFEETPPMGSILHAKAVPDIGGDTLWTNTYAAFDALSDKMQAFLGGLSAIHDYARPFFGAGGYNENGEERPTLLDSLAAQLRCIPVPDHAAKIVFITSCCCC